MKKLFISIVVCAIPLFFFVIPIYGQTQITRWQYDRNGAVSITFDDGSINQFKKAVPILNRLGFPATFFIITGQIPGSMYKGKFIGRPVKDIIRETATIPTDSSNFYERASAAGYLGLIGPLDYHYKAGELVDAGKTAEAYKVIDECYTKVRNGDFKPGIQHNDEYKDAHGTTWNDIRKYAAQGHEFASHMITHPRLAVLDEANMLYELKNSRLDILKQLGQQYTFSAEGPFGTENERVMSYAHKVYPALRNRMPEPWLKEISRSNRSNPGNTDKAYIQFQRGATTKTPLAMMETWVDTTLNKNNTWLVLTFHGVDGIGWEALTHQELDAYFSYIKKREDKLWVATFGDVTKYMRERQSAKVQATPKANSITVNLTCPLNKTWYNIPLTLKTYVPEKWVNVKVTEGKNVKTFSTISDSKGKYILYQAYPNRGTIILTAN
ncbi:polysaccharide deacetylase family protein [Mucilaginibacter segetis]|uniref:Polysaccharide deacetylase family protein n=1 Tax=Mucilaginibacter segetis TaxID=2793071 RepID=A0A934PWZ2_9SPHI|nr:polysaccharide deacetylase family protein [Mucilaginibacter segetis]MBK0381222.1 polysaccharide deacetylase family protein [Mucilaginibacter segetis]